MKNIVITGACGFIGTNLSLYFIKKGYRVIGVDNLSRKGSEKNLSILLLHPNFKFHQIDLLEIEKLNGLFQNAESIDAVFHLAAQVAVTLSYQDIRHDFNNNALATFNLLEAVKKYSPKAYCLYASTNKVFGNISSNSPVSNLSHPMSPYTPYGVSKAIGEMYFTEYGRSEIGLTTCVLRQSCIYGTFQHGVEDQGWLAWFALANINQEPITIYGDGEQIRDLLFVDDLIDLYDLCMNERISGSYTVGGGIENSISILNGLKEICDITKQNFASIQYQNTRAGDQPYFVADLSHICSVSDWRPKVNVKSGIFQMINWMKNHFVIDGKEIYLDRPEKTTAKETIQKFNDLYSQFLDGKDMIAIDIGANCGDSSIVIASCLAKGSKVICFEPGREAFPYLVHNVFRNNFCSIDMYNLAASDEYGELDFISSSENGGVMQEEFLNLRGKTVGEYKVRGVDLTDFLNKSYQKEELKKIKFIKIDCEGYDYIILKNLLPIIAESKPIIIIEWWKDSIISQKMFAIINHLKYTAFNIRDESVTEKDFGTSKYTDDLILKPI